MGEAQGHSPADGGHPDVHLGPEVHDGPLPQDRGLDATDKVAPAAGLGNVRVSGIHDAAHWSLDAPIRGRSVSEKKRKKFSLSKVSNFFHHHCLA